MSSLDFESFIDESEMLVFGYTTCLFFAYWYSGCSCLLRTCLQTLEASERLPKLSRSLSVSFFLSLSAFLATVCLITLT